MGGVECAAPVEVRAAGRTLTGPAVRYGEIAAGHAAERFEPGAFVSRAEPVGLNVQHDPLLPVADTGDGSLRLTDGPEALTVAAELRGDSVSGPLALVRRQALGGLSVGFVSLEERSEGGVRVISRAHLDHIGLVDRPSYRGSRVELRQLEGAWLRAMIPYGTRLDCECAGPVCDTVEFLEGSLDLGDGDTLAVGGNYLNVLGSADRGTLVTEDTPEGLRVGLTSRVTDTARKITEAAAVAPIYVRPLLDLEASEFTEEGRVRTFERAAVRALIVKPTTANGGHIAADIDGVPDLEERAVWL